jgi:hypothetical protein
MKIFVYCYNKPEYLTPQIKCLRKFIKEPFDFYCIDNSKDPKLTSKFIGICSQNEIIYTRNEKPDHSLEGLSHYAAMQWSWNNIINKTNEIIVMIDHDNFPIRELSIEKILDNNVIAGVAQSRGHVEYLNPALMIFNTRLMPNKTNISFKGSLIENQATDIGGEIYFYFKDNPNVNKKFLKSGPILKDDPILKDLAEKYGYPHTFDFIEDAFVHPRNGSNWSRVEQDEFNNREKLIFDLLDRNLK